MRSDGKLVVAATFANCLTTFSVNEDGNLRRTTSLPLGERVPDGLCIDAEDHIWVSSVYDKQVVRVSPDGEKERHRVGQMAFACVLGGRDRRTLFIATAPDFEPADRRAHRGADRDADSQRSRRGRPGPGGLTRTARGLRSAGSAWPPTGTAPAGARSGHHPGSRDPRPPLRPHRRHGDQRRRLPHARPTRRHRRVPTRNHTLRPAITGGTCT
jgi:hypothetical protein